MKNTKWMLLGLTALSLTVAAPPVGWARDGADDNAADSGSSGSGSSDEGLADDVRQEDRQEDHQEDRQEDRREDRREDRHGDDGPNHDVNDDRSGEDGEGRHRGDSRAMQHDALADKIERLQNRLDAAQSSGNTKEAENLSRDIERAKAKLAGIDDLPSASKDAAPGRGPRRERTRN